MYTPVACAQQQSHMWLGNWVTPLTVQTGTTPSSQHKLPHLGHVHVQPRAQPPASHVFFLSTRFSPYGYMRSGAGYALLGCLYQHIHDQAPEGPSPPPPPPKES